MGVKIASVYESAVKGAAVDKDFIEKTAAVFGETNAINFFRGALGLPHVKTASGETKGIGICAVIKAAHAGDPVDIDYLAKLASLDGVGWEGIESLMNMELGD